MRKLTEGFLIFGVVSTILGAHDHCRRSPMVFQSLLAMSKDPAP